MANAAPPMAATMEGRMDARLLAAACSSSFHDLESLLDGQAAAYTMGSSASQPPSLYAVTVGGDTLLHVVAASHGDSEELLNKARLVYDKAPSLLFVQNIQGDTPLHRAARKGNAPMVSLLVDLANGQGVNNGKGLLETQNKLKETALHEAVRFGSNDMVNLLMAHDPELATIPEEGTSPLYLAILLENKIIAETLYELSGGVLSYSGPNGQNALHVAVQRSQDLTKMLLEWNNDLTLQGDANGSILLHFAVLATLPQIKRDNQAMCSQLLKANPDALYQPDHSGSFPTHMAASTGATWVIDDFLMKSPNCAGLLDARGRTFLHVAVDRMNTRTVDYACRNISLSWILNMQDKDGNTALHLAIRKGSLRMFCSLFGNRQVQLNITNEKGMTPLGMAHHNLAEGLQMNMVNEEKIIKALKSVRTERGIFHQGFLNEYDIDKARQDEIHTVNQVKEGTQSRCIVAVLIATVTFGAMFAMPGGYRGDGHPNAGSPTLAGTPTFDVFILANALAFALSATAVISLMFSGDPTVCLPRRKLLFESSLGFIILSVASMIVAFIFGTGAVLASIAPVYVSAVLVSFAIVSIYHLWQRGYNENALFVAVCKRKGICYGIVACPSPPTAYLGILVLSLMFALSFVLMTHTGGKAEPPAQPLTPFA